VARPDYLWQQKTPLSRGETGVLLGVTKENMVELGGNEIFHHKAHGTLKISLRINILKF
jgi:hypothetical protein